MPNLPLDLGFMGESTPRTNQGLRELVTRQRSALITYAEHESQAKKTISAINSSLAIAAMAHTKSQLQLTNAAERQNKKKSNTCIKLDGWARLLTHPMFAQEIRKNEERVREQERQKQARGELHDAWEKVRDAQQCEVESWRTQKAEAKSNGMRFTEPAPKVMKKKEWVEKCWNSTGDDNGGPLDDDETEEI
jgi:hypothetical protein